MCRLRRSNVCWRRLRGGLGSEALANIFIAAAYSITLTRATATALTARVSNFARSQSWRNGRPLEPLEQTTSREIIAAARDCACRAAPSR